MAGGYLFTFFGAGRVTGLNLYSVLVATIGAIVVLTVYHGIRRITSTELRRSLEVMLSVRATTPLRIAEDL